MKKLSTLGMIIGASLLCAIPVSLHWSPAKAPHLSVDGAQARIGRPLTPFSVAGVHRTIEFPLNNAGGNRITVFVDTPIHGL